MDSAEALILGNGFSGTSIDQIIDKVGITKGAFFYHFKTKDELARSLIDRYVEADRRLLHDSMARAENLSRDPLQQLLIFVGLFLEVAERSSEPNPGCLFASYCYESGQFDDEMQEVVGEAILEWRRVIGAKLEEAVAAHPPKEPIHLASLADMLTVVFEGAFILSRVLKGPKVFAEQLRHYRRYIELLFA